MQTQFLTVCIFSLLLWVFYHIFTISSLNFSLSEIKPPFSLHSYFLLPTRFPLPQFGWALLGMLFFLSYHCWLPIYLLVCFLFIIFFMYFQSFSPVYNFTTPLVAGDPSPHKILTFGDHGVDFLLSPGAHETSSSLIKEVQKSDIRMILHNGDISYAMGYVSISHIFVTPFTVLHNKLYYL